MKNLSTRLTLALAAMLTACGDDGSGADAAPTPDAYEAKGTFTLAWTLSDGTTSVTCADVKADQVVIRELPTSGAPGYTDSWNCESGMGESQERMEQEYDVEIELVNSAGQTMATATRVENVTVPDNATADLGTAAFVVSRTGGFRFVVDVAAAGGSNCDPETAMPQPGAGITGMQVELRPQGGACQPVTFAVAGGGTYDASCGGAPGACIAGDELTAEGVNAGSYVLSIVGYEGANACYTLEASFDVSGGDQIRNLNMLLLPIDSMNMMCVAP